MALIAKAKEKAQRAPKTVVVMMPAFEEGKPIPREYTGHGDDESPEIRWSGVPDGAKALAIIVDDPDAPGGTYTHWLVWDLPPVVRTIDRKANMMNVGGTEGKNDFGFGGYMGPKPPSGTHRYHFQVFALKEKLGLPADSDAAAVWNVLSDKVVAWGERVGKFTKP